jgi:GNAT superfamily N-acetyltransferase
MNNFERMMKLADEVFQVKDDPSQLDVDESVIERLLEIHPASVSEYDDGNGPAAWILLIPTTKQLMDEFLEKKISEKDLFERTPVGILYDTIYLCSAMVLEEYRRKGVAKRLTMDAVQRIRDDHPIKHLFVWAFSDAGTSAAQALSKITGLPLHNRE